MKIPVILLNYNSYDDCCQCCEDLQRQQGVEVEIVVVDNGSAGSEGEAGRGETERGEAVKKLRTIYGCTLIEVGENRGYNAGNNIGLRYAAEKGYELALIANPDMRFPQEDYIVRLIIEMEHDAEIVACGSDIQTPNGIHQNPRHICKSYWWNCFNWVTEFLHKREFKNTPTWVDNPHESRYCNCINGCCLMVRLSFIQEIGFFDESTFLYGEEPIFGRQVELAGKKMFYTANATAIHAHKKSKEGSAAFCTKHWKHSRKHFIQRYSGYPFYGKWFALLSISLYFFTLNQYHRIKKQ